MLSCSVIIPVYKEPEIENTIKNIIYEFRANKIQTEIILIVDKAPNDNTDIIVQGIAKKYNEIQYSIRDTKKGVCPNISCRMPTACASLAHRSSRNRSHAAGSGTSGSKP